MFGFWMIFIFSNQTSTGKCKEMAQLYAIIPLGSFIDRPDHLPLFCPLSLCILNQSTAIAVTLAMIYTKKNKSRNRTEILNLQNIQLEILQVIENSIDKSKRNSQNYLQRNKPKFPLIR